MAAGPGMDGEIDEVSPQLWGPGFAEVVAIEPAILELVVARMARLAYGCRVEGDGGGDGGANYDDDDGNDDEGVW